MYVCVRVCIYITRRRRQRRRRRRRPLSRPVDRDTLDAQISFILCTKDISLMSKVAPRVIEQQSVELTARLDAHGAVIRFRCRYSAHCQVDSLCASVSACSAGHDATFTDVAAARDRGGRVSHVPCVKRAPKSTRAGYVACDVARTAADPPQHPGESRVTKSGFSQGRRPIPRGAR